MLHPSVEIRSPRCHQGSPWTQRGSEPSVFGVESAMDSAGLCSFAVGFTRNKSFICSDLMDEERGKIG